MKTLLLLGGGHSHVEVLRRFGLHAPRDTRIILVSPDRHTAYSGMLPGLVAGHYAFEDCHIDLMPLCDAARAEFLATRASGLDPAARRVTCADGTSLAYDILSIDIGAVAETASIPGAHDHAVPVRPVAAFLRAWQRLLGKDPGTGCATRSVAIVGGGPGGIEIALAMHHRLQSSLHELARPAFHILTDGETILPGLPRRAQRLVERICLERGIALHVRSRITLVEPETLHRAGNAPVAADHVFLATGPSAPSWIAASGLETDARGFIAVNDALQSPSHPGVFAAGDIATMVNHPRPKSGVYAVRQGPPLAGNLRRMLADLDLVTHAPQSRALALISTGRRHAIACLGQMAVAGDWVWRWKDWIDRRFVAAYRVRSGAR